MTHCNLLYSTGYKIKHSNFYTKMKATGGCSLWHCPALCHFINILPFQNALAARSTTEISGQIGTGLEDITFMFHT